MGRTRTQTPSTPMRREDNHSREGSHSRSSFSGSAAARSPPMGSRRPVGSIDVRTDNFYPTPLCCIFPRGKSFLARNNQPAKRIKQVLHTQELGISESFSRHEHFPCLRSPGLRPVHHLTATTTKEILLFLKVFLLQRLDVQNHVDFGLAYVV